MEKRLIYFAPEGATSEAESYSRPRFGSRNGLVFTDSAIQNKKVFQVERTGKLKENAEEMEKIDFKLKRATAILKGKIYALFEKRLGDEQNLPTEAEINKLMQQGAKALSGQLSSNEKEAIKAYYRQGDHSPVIYSILSSDWYGSLPVVFVLKVTPEGEILPDQLVG
jgi:hypothetical protein